MCFTYSDEIGKDDSVFKCGCDQCVRRRKRQRTNARKSVAQWVQCDDCEKWRQTPYTIEELKSVPSTWRCGDNPAYTAPEGADAAAAAAAACAEPEEAQEDEETYVLDEEEEEDLIFSEDDEDDDADERAAKRRKRGNLAGLSVEGPGGISLETAIAAPEPKRKKGGSSKESSARVPAPSKPVIVAKTAAEWDYVRDPPVVLPEGKCQPELDDAAMQLRLWEEICAATDHPDGPEDGGGGEGGRVLSELFMRLPERVTLPETAPFPKPSPIAPEIQSGDVAMLVMGKLPNMVKRLPTQQELATWDKPSQLAFWEQRRTYWGSGKGSGGTGWSGWKLGDLQREARKRGIFPGGDIGFVRNRLLRYDYCKDQLLACETRSEEDCIREEMQIGVLYYKIVKQPIDLTMIKARIDGDGGGYADLGALEKDLLLLFANAKRFDADANDEDDDSLTGDATALLSVMKATVRRMRTDSAGLGKANKHALQAAVRAAAVYASQEVRRWEMRPGSLTKKKRVRKRAEEEGDGGREWVVVGGRGEGNVLVLKCVGDAQAVAAAPAAQPEFAPPETDAPAASGGSDDEAEAEAAAKVSIDAPAKVSRPRGRPPGPVKVKPAPRPRGRPPGPAKVKPAGASRPRGRPPAGMQWDAREGAWAPVPGYAGSPRRVQGEFGQPAQGDCPQCANGSRKPAGHKGRHLTRAPTTDDDEEAEAEPAPQKRGAIGSLVGAW